MDAALIILAGVGAVWIIAKLLVILFPALFFSGLCVGCASSAWELSSVASGEWAGLMIAAQFIVMAYALFMALRHWRGAMQQLGMG